MAILEHFSGVEVVVCTAGAAIEEYDAENDEVKHVNVVVSRHHQNVTVTKYIESTTGHEFSIKLSVKKSFKLDTTSLGFFVYIDGEYIGGRFMDRAHFSGDTWSSEIFGPALKLGNAFLVRTMKFAQIQTTSENIESAIINQQKNKLSRVGEIKVEVFRVSIGKICKERAVLPLAMTSYSPTVHEKALKGDPKSHGVTLGAFKADARITPYEYTKLGGRDFPKAIFKFKYRSKESLQSLLIILRSPSPEPESPPGAATAGPEPASRAPDRSHTGNPGNLSDEDYARYLLLSERIGGRNSANPQGGVVKEKRASLPAGTIKRENNDGGGNTTPLQVGTIKQESAPLLSASTIKREGAKEDNNGGGAPKRRRKLPGKVTIDLTEDDDEGPEYIPLD